MQNEGTIIKGIAGFYYVVLPDNRVIECKARGKFRNDKQVPIVGDRVLITISEMENNGDKGIVDEILQRKSQLARPLVANVDQAFIIFALRKPDINLMLLDKLLILVEHNNLEAIICLNKSDLDDNDIFEKISEEYQHIGYKVIKTNGHTGEGIEQIKACAEGKISVFVGPSGVGKSTIFNQIQSKLVMKTGEISTKIDRGKHTTRHAELIEICKGSFVVDTPGFSSMELDFIKPENLQYNFKDFEEYLNCCKFTSCLHNKEIDCRIKKEVENGNISKERYNTYVSILENLLQEQNFRRNKR
jgi:ribosome biogenesis GTPase / thiamine phosphate phosphatase